MFINRIMKMTLLLLAALPLATPAQEHVNPVDVFEQTWQTFNTNYPYFDHSSIDWEAIHRVYRPKVTAESTDEELFRVLCNMLGLLNDGHVNLKNGKTGFNAGIIHELTMDDYSRQLVYTKYLKGKFEARQDSNFVYGWLNEDIAYLSIKRWKQKHLVGAIVDSILFELTAAKGLIIDVRDNTGGNAFAAQEVANRFADRKRLFMKSYPKLGPGHDSFFPPLYAYVAPAGPVQFTGSVVILQHRFSESATELFIMAMHVLPNISTVGEITSGCFGAYYTENLLNGWNIGMPWFYETDQNDHCWVGTGIPPDLRLINSKEDIASGRDRVIEFAIELISRGGHFGSKGESSLKDIRISLYKRFRDTAEKDGIEIAVAEFRRLQTEEPNKVYFSAQECMLEVNMLLETGKLDELAAIMELAHEAWPDAIAFPFILGIVYEEQGLSEKAVAAYRKVAGREAFFPWDKGQVMQAEEHLNKN
jgi:hypothetical protein